MLICEGYKMFRGKVLVSPVKSSGIEPFEETGVCLYKPDTSCWYINGRSYSEAIVTILRDETE